MTDLDENEFRWLPFPMGYEEPAPHAGPVNFDELVLLSVDFRGPGTIQARIGIIRPVDNGVE